MIKESEVISRTLLLIEQYKGSYSGFRSAILQNDYTPKSKNFSRLLLWKTCLITETLNIQAWKDKLTASRMVYHQLRKSPDMVIPWWTLDSDNEFYAAKNPDKSTKRQLVRVHNVTDDPLSSGSSQEPSSDESDSELLTSIVLDIQRLFPGEAFFHSDPRHSLSRKRQLVTVLYIWAKCNVHVGYKQGLHEILGLIYKNISGESVSLSNTNTSSVEDLSILSLYDIHYLEHDIFSIFNKFMVASGVISAFYESEARLMASIETFNSLLMKVDQLIHYNLVTKLRIDSQLWVIRFLRLLLLRELGSDLEVTSSFWDKLAAAEASKTSGSHCIPDLVTFAIITLLVHLKTELALCDFSEALSLLLHYPISTRINLHPDFINSLFKDANGLVAVKDNDLKLYEFGLKLNKKYNTRLKVNLNYTSGGESSRSATASPKGSVELPTPGDSRKANMAFEKSRLEMRLKKKAQSMVKN